ncbi:MAG: O-antigen ligase family protein [Acidobacteriota bacterium]
MRINRSDLAFYIFAAFALLISFYTIVVHIGFIFLPLFFLITGIVVSFLPEGRGLKIFFFLFPLINSLPALFFNGYAFNLMATILFFLAGIIIGTSFKHGIPEFDEFEWSGPYLFFLTLIWISVIFVLLRWSNITIPAGAFLADTPVSPGHPISPRISFAIIFPVITLFLFSITPFSVALIKKYSLKRDQIYKSLIGGYSCSVILALYQKLFDSGFLSISWWGDEKNQYNGGFSDFNGFGFFGGFIFLYSSLKLIDIFTDKLKTKYNKEILFFFISFIISFFGIILSGSRTAFIFVIFAFIFLIFSKIKTIIKTIIPVIVIIVLLFSGGELVKRLERTFDSSKLRPKSIIKVMDRITNGRVRMIINSVPIVTENPVSGIGAGTFLFHLKYITYEKKIFEDLPLNQYLLFLDELGITGLISFLFFIFILLRRKQNDMYFKIFAVFLLVMFVGNSLWLPELLILFWISVMSLTGPAVSKKYFSGKRKIFLYIILLIFITGNILSMSSLHPSKLMAARDLPYDFGFWTESSRSNFVWTKDESGILLKFDENGNYGPVKFFCGAPVDKLPEKSQNLRIYINGKEFAGKKFTSNSEFKILLNGVPGEEFFLGIKVDPVFNLKKMGLGPETRNLGVQFFPVPDGP